MLTDELRTGGTDLTAQMAQEIGELTDWAEHTLNVPREVGESVSDWIRRAFRMKATVESNGVLMERLPVLTELGATTLLANRQRASGNQKFGNVLRDTNERDFEYSFRRDGKTDRFRLTSDRREYRRLTFKKPVLEKSLGELLDRKANIERAVASMESSLEMVRMNFERKMPSERNLETEQASVDDAMSKIRLAKSELPGIEAEIERVRPEIEECKGATLSRYSTLHEIPKDAILEIEVRWRSNG